MYGHRGVMHFFFKVDLFFKIFDLANSWFLLFCLIQIGFQDIRGPSLKVQKLIYERTKAYDKKKKSTF